MPSLGGAIGGATTGLKLGSFAGPWGSAIGAGIGGIVGLFTGGKSKLQKNLEGKIDPSLNNLMHWSGQSMDKQNAYHNIAMPAIKGSAKFYGNLMNDATAMDAMLGPNRTAVNDQYQAVVNQGMYAGRGGGRNSSMVNADFARNRALLELIPQMRLQAAQGQMQVGQLAGGQALQWGNLGTNQANSVLSVAAGGTLQNLQQQQAATDQGWAGIASSLGEMLGPMLSGIKGGKAGNPVGSAGTGAGATLRGLKIPGF